MSELESLFSQAPVDRPEPPEEPEERSRRKLRHRIRSASLYSKTVVVLVVLALIGGGGEYYRLHRNSIPALPPIPRGTPGAQPIVSQDPLHANFALLDAAEQSYFKVFAQWTSDKKALDDYGVGTSLQPGTVILVGANPAKDFCFVGSYGDRAPYLLFDSARHGVQPEPALTAVDAASRCSDHTIKDFYPVT